MLIFVITFFFAKIGLSQQTDTTTKSVKISQKQEVVDIRKDSLKKSPKKTKLKLKGFVDKNADGIDDRLANKNSKGRRSQQKRRDLFIDQNGDGICDGRESAIGIKKAMRHRRGKK